MSWKTGRRTQGRTEISPLFPRGKRHLSEKRSLQSLSNPKCLKSRHTQTRQERAQPPLETTHLGEDKTCSPALRFYSCLIYNSRVRWRSVSYVISGMKELRFLGTSSVNPQGACCQHKQGSHCVQQGTCASIVTCAQAFAFLSPMET